MKLNLFSIIASIVMFVAGAFGTTRGQVASFLRRVSEKPTAPGYYERIGWGKWLRLRFILWVRLVHWNVMPALSGGAGINGARVILYVNISESAADQWTRVGGQAGLNFNDTTAEIDVSDKLSGRLGERVPGRATASVALELNFLTDDPAQEYIKEAYRLRESIMVRRFYRDTADSETGIAIEEATGIIVDLSETHPDQDKSTMSLEVSLNNDWEPSV